jgi:hypothetical protein
VAALASIIADAVESSAEASFKDCFTGLMVACGYTTFQPLNMLANENHPQGFNIPNEIDLLYKKLKDILSRAVAPGPLSILLPGGGSRRFEDSADFQKFIDDVAADACRRNKDIAKPGFDLSLFQGNQGCWELARAINAKAVKCWCAKQPNIDPAACVKLKNFTQVKLNWLVALDNSYFGQALTIAHQRIEGGGIQVIVIKNQMYQLVDYAQGLIDTYCPISFNGECCKAGRAILQQVQKFIKERETLIKIILSAIAQLNALECPTTTCDYNDVMAKITELYGRAINLNKSLDQLNKDWKLYLANLVKPTCTSSSSSSGP